MGDAGDDSVGQAVSNTLLTTAGVIALLFGGLMAVSSAYQLLVTGPRPALLPIVAVAVVFVSIGLVTVAPLRERLQDRHGVGTTGRVRTVDRRTVKNADERCTSCGRRVDRGVVRRYRDEFVVAGFPLTRDHGYNYYCLDCRSGSPDGDESDAPEREREST